MTYLCGRTRRHLPGVRTVAQSRSEGWGSERAACAAAALPCVRLLWLHPRGIAVRTPSAPQRYREERAGAAALRSGALAVVRLLCAAAAAASARGRAEEWDGSGAPEVWEAAGATEAAEREGKKNETCGTWCNAIGSLCPRDKLFLFCVSASHLPPAWKASLLLDSL